MKRFLKSILALTMVLNIMPLRTVRAEDTADKTVKVEATISSTLNNGETTEVSGKVYDDYSFLIELPNKAVNAGNATITLRMKDIASLGISGERQKTYTLTTGLNIEKNLYEALNTIAGDAGEHLFGFDGVKIAVTVKADTKEAATEYQVTGSAFDASTGESKKITGTVNESTARAAWLLITDQVTAATKSAEDSYIVIANGSYMQLGKEKLVFEKEGDLRLENFNQLEALIEHIKEYVKVEDTEDNAIVFALKAGTELAVGQSSAKLDTDVKMTVTGRDVSSLKILSTLRDNTSSDVRQVIIGLLTLMNTVLGEVDAANNLTVLMDFDYRVVWEWADDCSSAVAKFYSPVDDTLVGEETAEIKTTVEPTCVVAGEYLATVEFNGAEYTSEKFGTTDPDAETKDYKFILQVSSDTADNETGSVTATVYPDYTADLVIYGDKVALSNARLAVWMKNVASLGVSDPRHHEITVNTGMNGEVSLDYVVNLFSGLQNAAIVAKVKDSKNSVTYTIKNIDGRNITATPNDTYYAREVWHEIVNSDNVKVETLEADDSKAEIKKGSYVKVNGYILTVDKDLTLDNLNDPNALMDTIEKAVTLTEAEEAVQGVEIYLEGGTQLTIGSSKAEVVRDSRALIKVYDEEALNDILATLQSLQGVDSLENVIKGAFALIKEVCAAMNGKTTEVEFEFGHRYEEYEIVWAEDHKSAELHVLCLNNEGHEPLVIPAEVNVETTPATCEEAGKTVYTATATYEGVEYSDVYEEEIEALGHVAGEAAHENEVAATCTEDGGYDLVVRCTRCNEILSSEHFVEEALGHEWGEWAVTTAPTCTEDGVETRECSRCHETETRPVEAIGHKWGEPTWKWATDHSTAYALFTCENAASHIQLLEGTITSETTAATCEADGKTVYTATVNFEGKDYTDVQEVVIPATGHDWSEPEWAWAADHNTATATFRCANDHDHDQTVDATVEISETSATCEEAGNTVYTAKVTFNEKDYTDVQKVMGEPLGHVDGEITYVWAEDLSSVTATLYCGREGDTDHVLATETVATTVTEEKATALKKSKTTYTAEFENEKFETQVKEFEGDTLDYKFIMQVSSETSNGVGAVTGTVYPDYTADLVIDQANVALSNVTIGFWMKNVASLGVDGVRHHAVTIPTGLGDGVANLSKVKELFDGLSQAAIVAKVKGSANSVTYTLTNEGWVINAVPNSTEFARAVWHEIVNSDNVKVETLAADDSKAEIKAGSFVQINNYILKVDTDLTLDNLNDTDALMTAIKDAVSLKETEEVVDGVVVYLEGGTQLTIGSSKAEVVRDSRANINVYDEEALADMIKTLKSLQGVDSLTKVIKGAFALIEEVCDALDGKTTEVEFEFGHRYEDKVEFVWGENHKSAELHVLCLNNEGHEPLVIPATVTEETTDATCEEAGKTVYTAKATFEEVEYTDVQEVVIPATGHDWGEPTWKWANDHSMALAFFTCGNNATHIQVVEATITSETTEPTCEAAGKTVYTAKATFEGEDYTNTQEEEIAALGHDYELTGWTWAEDYSTATVKFTCKNDATHVEEIPATITSETTAATCETAGKTVYTAKATFEEVEYTDVKEVDIPATGHAWGEPTITWGDTLPGMLYPTTATATRVCANDESHVETVNCEVEVVEENAEYVTLKATGKFSDGTIATEEKKFEVDKLRLRLEAMSTDGITVAWDAIDCDVYELYRDNVLVATTTVAEYLDNVDWNSAAVRTMGKTYTYKVRGIYAADSTATGYSEIEVLYNPFEDVEEGTDEFTYIAWAYNYYIVNGTSKTTYSPEANCLRDQFCIMLYKLNGLPSVEGTAPFEDIATETSNTRKAIVWCYLEGIVAGLKGQPTVFNPRGDISRSQLAIMLYRMGGSPEVDITDLHFTDIASQTSNTKKAIVWCYQNGIIPSIDGDLFEPNKKGSRALLTEMMYQYDQIYHLSDELDLQH